VSTLATNLIAIAVVFGAFFYFKYKFRPGAKPAGVIPDPGAPIPKKVIERYAWILDRIRGAATVEETGWCIGQSYEFEAQFRSICDVGDMFLDLLGEAHKRERDLRFEKKKKIQ
jgi:hypothetical protein